jgi:hypothetical protein
VLPRKIEVPGVVAKWQGKGLQNPHRGFDSRRRLRIGFSQSRDMNPVLKDKVLRDEGLVPHTAEQGIQIGSPGGYGPVDPSAEPHEMLATISVWNRAFRYLRLRIDRGT